MSSCDRRLVLRGGVLALGGVVAGCFRPMLAEDAPARALRGLVALPPVDSRFEHYLHRSLEDHLGSPEAPVWRLEVETELDEDDLAITPDDAVTRVSVTARADYRLLPAAGGAPVLEDRAISQSGYNATGSVYATRVVARDIEQRLARELGLRIARHVLAAAGRLERS